MSNSVTKEMLAKCFGIAYKTTKKRDILDYVLDMLAVAQNDSEKAGDMDTYWYSIGLADAYEGVARFIAPVEDLSELEMLLHKDSTLAVPGNITDTIKENAA